LEYFKDYNGTKAAIRAGYKPKNAGVQASQLLTLLKVQAAVRDYEENLATRFLATKERVLKELSLSAFSDIDNYFDENWKVKNLKDLTPQISRAIKKLKITRIVSRPTRGENKDVEFITENVEFELHDKTSALQLMGKEIGMFKERTELSGGVYTFVVEYTDSDKPDPDDKENNK
jgi:phage terminase small subunit